MSLSQTPCSFRFFQIPDECSAADHRYLVPNADRKLAAATYPILGWDGPHWVPAPRMLRDVVWILTRASLPVTVSMCAKAVFRRCSAARPFLGAEIPGVSLVAPLTAPTVRCLVCHFWPLCSCFCQPAVLARDALAAFVLCDAFDSLHTCGIHRSHTWSVSARTLGPRVCSYS